MADIPPLSATRPIVDRNGNMTREMRLWVGTVETATDDVNNGTVTVVAETIEGPVSVAAPMAMQEPV